MSSTIALHLIFLRQGLSLNLELNVSATLPCQQLPGIYLHPNRRAWVTGANCCTWYLFELSVSLKTESSLQLPKLTFQKETQKQNSHSSQRKSYVVLLTLGIIYPVGMHTPCNFLKISSRTKTLINYKNKK